LVVVAELGKEVTVMEAQEALHALTGTRA